MYTDTPADTRQFLQGKSVVDLGGCRIVDRKGLHAGTRQIHRRYRQFQRRKIDTARKVFEQKALEMKIMRRTNAATLFQQMRGRKPSLGASGFQRLGFRAIAIRLVKKLIEHRPELGRQGKGCKLADHALDG